MNRLLDKVAIVTGAGMGIGEATAVLFAREGARVAVVDINDQAGQQVANKIRAEGGMAEFWHLDVSNEENCKSVVSEVVRKWGKLDVLVNNAGITGVDKQTHEYTSEEWDAVYRVDVKGVFFMTKYAVPEMKKNGQGSIVNLSSIWGLVGSQEFAAYHAAKGAVTLMTKKDAVVYGPDHIRVNSLHPGTVLTPLIAGDPKYMAGGMEHDIALTPLGYLGQPEDIGYAALFLASDEARFLTGANIPVDGGYTAQ